MALKLFALETENNCRRVWSVTAAVAAENHFTTFDHLEQLASFNVMCQRHTANGDTMHLCSGKTTGPDTVLTSRVVGGGVSTLGAFKAAILLLHSPQTLLADEVQTAQEVGVS